MTEDEPEKVELDAMEARLAALRSRLDQAVHNGDPERIAAARLKGELFNLAIEHPRDLLPERFRGLPVEDLARELFRAVCSLLRERVGQLTYARTYGEAKLALQAFESTHFSMDSVMRGCEVLEDCTRSLDKERLKSVAGLIQEGQENLERLRRVLKALRGMSTDREARLFLLEYLAQYASGDFEKLDEFRHHFPLEQLNVTDEQFVEAARVLTQTNNEKKWSVLASMLASMGMGTIAASSLKQEWKIARGRALEADGLFKPLPYIPTPATKKFQRKSLDWFRAAAERLGVPLPEW